MFNCPLCQNNEYTLLYERGRHNKEVKNYICEQCGFVFILPRPESDELKRLYVEGDFSSKERKLKRPDDLKFEQCEKLAIPRFYSLQSYLKQNSLNSTETCRKVLDVGCGTGSFLRLMRGAGWNVLGLEPDFGYAEAVQDRYGIHIEKKILEDVCVDEKFDLISSFHVIEHVPDPNIFLQHIHSLLNENGIVYLECPSIDRWYGDNIDFFFWDVHINTFSRTVLQSFMAKNGFEIQQSGWHGNGLWVIAKKVEVNKEISLKWDEPGRVRKIVELAASGKRQKFDEIDPLTKLKFKFKYKAKSLKERIYPKAPNAGDVAVMASRRRSSSVKIAHVGLHENANAGDTLLFPAIRHLFQKQVGDIDFELVPLREEVTEKTIELINKQDALLIGGGGLFLADTNPNSSSGWQWGCSPELLEKIKVPIILFAVGYNRFRGQQEFSAIFKESLTRIVEKSSFVGIRNRGSIEALKTYLPESLHSKLVFQPCATTFLSKYYPGALKQEKSANKILAVNIAFDRHHLRFGKNEDKILWSLADALSDLINEGWMPKLFIHMRKDAEADVWFKSRGLELEHVNLEGVPPDVVIQEYRKASLAIGMRGHAQMIPFGLNRPIYSLVSHDKLRFFIEDIHHPEWGIEVHNENLRKTLVSDLNEFDRNLTQIESKVECEQNMLWSITLENLISIKEIIGVS